MRNISSQTICGLMSGVGSARQFATGWQDYLLANNAGKYHEGHEIYPTGKRR